MRVADRLGNEFDLRPRDCPTCGAGEKRRMGTRGGSTQRSALGIETTIVQCATCGLIFPDPFPYPVDPQKLYGDPTAYFGDRDTDECVLHYETAIADLLRRSRAHSPRILDVGCGRGELVRAALKMGLAAVGLEFADAMIQFAREHHGVEVRKLSIEELAATDERFDGVFLNAVLEHVYEPASMIRAVRTLLRPGGVLFIDVPNEPNLLTKVGRVVNKLRGSSVVYNLSPTWPPYHVYGFNPQALRVLLAKHDLVVEELSIWADPRIPATGGVVDRVKSAVATGVNRVANRTRTAANLTLWARRIGEAA
jgi:SAM-dependent methyltransferase